MDWKIEILKEAALRWGLRQLQGSLGTFKCKWLTLRDEGLCVAGEEVAVYVAGGYVEGECLRYNLYFSKPWIFLPVVP